MRKSMLTRLLPAWSWVLGVLASVVARAEPLYCRPRMWIWSVGCG